MGRSEPEPSVTHSRSGVLVIGCWVGGEHPVIRVTPILDSHDAPARSVSTRDAAHAELDAWLDRLGVAP